MNGTPAIPRLAPNAQQVLIIRGGGKESSSLVKKGALAIAGINENSKIPAISVLKIFWKFEFFNYFLFECKNKRNLNNSYFIFIVAPVF
jgi:hypothetical protein